MGSLEQDVHDLHHAIAGLGTDDRTLVTILTHRTKQQLEQIAQAYEAKHNHTLAHDIRGDTSFNERAILEALATPYTQYVANEINHAVKGLGTHEGALRDILITQPRSVIDAAKPYYQEKFGKTIEEDVIGDTSGNFRKALVHLIGGSRDFSGPPDFSSVEHDAQAIHKAGEGRIGTDDEFFVEYFTKKSPAHIAEVDKVYRIKHSHSLEHAIKGETSGDYEQILAGLLVTPTVYWARRIHQAVKGLGTNDALLVRAFVLNDREHLKHIAAVYQEEFGHSLAQDISGDTSGYYEKALLGLLE